VAADLGARRYLGLGHIYNLAIGTAERMAQGARPQGAVVPGNGTGPHQQTWI
jgi:hypothetical protein